MEKKNSRVRKINISLVFLGLISGLVTIFMSFEVIIFSNVILVELLKDAKIMIFIIIIFSWIYSAFNFLICSYVIYIIYFNYKEIGSSLLIFIFIELEFAVIISICIFFGIRNIPSFIKPLDLLGSIIIFTSCLFAISMILFYFVKPQKKADQLSRKKDNQT